MPIPSVHFTELDEIVGEHPRRASLAYLNVDDSDGFAALMQHATSLGLHMTLRSYESMVVMTFGDIENLDRLNKAMDQADHGEVGFLLGVPACCRAQFVDLTPIPEDEDLWVQSAINSAVRRNKFTYHWAFNPRYSFLRFYPCRFDCPNAFEVSKSYFRDELTVHETVRIQGHTFHFNLDTLN